MTVSVEQAQRSLKELIERTSRGEQIVITQDQKPVAELRPLPAAAIPTFGSCRGMLTVVSEDDDHLDDFREYMK
jgi:prevent-host-death family protein